MTTVASAEGGYLRPVSSVDGHTGGAAHFRLEAVNRRRENWGLGGGLRIKGASEVKQLSISFNVLYTPLGIRAFVPYLRGGVNEFQFESVDGSFGYGMFSPFAEAGVMLRVARDKRRGGTYLTIGGFTEYDLRFTDQRSRAYWGLMVGIASVARGRDPALRERRGHY